MKLRPSLVAPSVSISRQKAKVRFAIAKKRCSIRLRVPQELSCPPVAVQCFEKSTVSGLKSVAR